MSEWRDEALVLAVRPQGESSALLTVFARDHGRHSGLVRGGAGRRLSAHLQPGNELDLTWRARLEDQLGTFTVEPLRSRAALLGDRMALEGLGALSGLLLLALPEREAHQALWSETRDLLDQMTRITPGNVSWMAHYVLWELRLLQEIGYGLDLSACAVTGVQEGLAYVSPKTGRAVTAAAAGDWAGRLLPLPLSLARGEPPTGAELLPGLALSGHFLARHLMREGEAGAKTGLPAARERLLALIARQNAGGGGV